MFFSSYSVLGSWIFRLSQAPWEGRGKLFPPLKCHNLWILPEPPFTASAKAPLLISFTLLARWQCFAGGKTAQLGCGACWKWDLKGRGGTRKRAAEISCYLIQFSSTVQQPPLPLRNNERKEEVGKKKRSCNWVRRGNYPDPEAEGK